LKPHEQIPRGRERKSHLGEKRFDEFRTNLRKARRICGTRGDMSRSKAGLATLDTGGDNLL
jgi:hypothetical protein